MPREYELKKPVLTKNRMQKIGKGILKDCNDDRKLAITLYRELKIKFDSDDKEGVTARDLNDALKLAQASKVNAIKTIELIAKLDGLGTPKSSKESRAKNELDLFAQLK